MSAGNGALMRTLPVGIAYKNPLNVYQWAISIAKMTHWDIRAGLTCAVYSLAVRNILDGTLDQYLALTKAAKVEGKDFEDAVVRAVNLGGDADTIGAIAGGLAGVYWGYGAIPDRWLEKFTPEQRTRLDRAAEGLLKVREGH